MAETKVAKRYAKALLDLGMEKNILPELNNDMQLVHSTIKENRLLSEFFKSPIIHAEKKNAIIKEVFGSKVNPVSLTFFSLITRKKREYFIEDITLAFIELYKVYNHQQTAWLTTAITADDQIRKQILGLIGKTTQDKIELIEKVDPSIIGGFILHWGDYQVDTSVTKKLHALRQDFQENLYQKDY